MLKLYDPKSGETAEEPMSYTHLCPNADCECTEDLLKGLLPGTGPMSPPAPEWLQEAEEWILMGFKRREHSSQVKPMANAWVDQGDKVDYPNIFGFLTETVYDDGKPRMTGSISIFTQVGVLKASISDKDNNKVAYVEALNLMELVAMIENAIFAEDTVWKDQQPYKKPPY